MAEKKKPSYFAIYSQLILGVFLVAVVFGFSMTLWQGQGALFTSQKPEIYQADLAETQLEEKILFWEEHTHGWQNFMINPDGSSKQEIPNFYWLKIHPDGEIIGTDSYYSPQTSKNEYRLYKKNITGTRSELLFEQRDCYIYDFASSPDGSEIVYTCDFFTQGGWIKSELNIYNLQTKEQKKLIEGFLLYVYWTRDNYIYFSKADTKDWETRKTEIYKLDPDSLQITKIGGLTEGFSVYYKIGRFTICNNKIYFNAVFSDYIKNGIYVMNLDGTGIARLPSPFNSNHYEAVSSCSPDQQWLLFNSERNGNIQIYKIRTDGTGIQQLSELTNAKEVYGLDWGMVDMGTEMPASTPTPTLTSTPIPTQTPVPTSTPLPTATSSPIPTQTPIPTATTTLTPTSTLTPSPTPTLKACPAGAVCCGQYCCDEGNLGSANNCMAGTVCCLSDSCVENESQCPEPTNTPSPSPTSQPQQESVCGNNICEQNETVKNCYDDCCQLYTVRVGDLNQDCIVNSADWSIMWKYWSKL